MCFAQRLKTEIKGKKKKGEVSHQLSNLSMFL